MKKTVWTFGLAAGAIMSAMMLLIMKFADQIGFDRGEIIGYTSMVLAFLLVFFGVRSYRETVCGGRISFRRAFTVGILITAVSCACYVATWEFLYYNVASDFGDKYAAHQIDKARAAGATQADIDARVAEMKRFKEMYKNPLINAAITFVEPFPVGLLITLVCAVLLRKRPDEPGGVGAAPATAMLS